MPCAKNHVQPVIVGILGNVVGKRSLKWGQTFWTKPIPKNSLVKSQILDCIVLKDEALT